MAIEDYLGEKFGLFGHNAEEAKAIVFGVPLEVTTSFKPGTKFGPTAIREASMQTENDKVITKDVGDVWVTPGNLEETLSRVEGLTKEILKEGKPVALGGEHTITLPILKNFDDIVILHFDAHADLRDELNGDKVCHATVMRRVFEKHKNLIQFGVRSLCEEEKKFIQENDIKSFSSQDVHENLQELKKLVSKETQRKRVYVSFDIDALDPAIAPGTGTPEPNGLSFLETIGLIDAIQGEVVGCDIVEVARDQEYLTPTMAVRILMKILEKSNDRCIT